MEDNTNTSNQGILLSEADIKFVTPIERGLKTILCLFLWVVKYKNIYIRSMKVAKIDFHFILLTLNVSDRLA